MAKRKIVDLSSVRMHTIGGKNLQGKPYPVSFEGYYAGSSEVPDETKKDGINYKHFFQLPTGEVVGVYGKTHLNSSIKDAIKRGELKHGEYLTITQNGTRKLAKGTMLLYELEVSDDRPVVTITTPIPKSSVEDEEEMSDEVSQDVEEEFDNEPTVRTQTAVSSAERAAKVQAILKGNRKA